MFSAFECIANVKAKFGQKCQVSIENKTSIECTVDSEWTDVINFIVSCSVVELFIHKTHKNPDFEQATLL